ncbi:hypothetical protein C8R44DRAFT_986882 [Mycena epipterygia]|nr:hypothetical protein C8R44DRAFT_986882 [Mycena epipterygia]
MSQVPNELWLEVFHHLPRDALKDVSLARRTFCCLSRPLLFTDFDFHPYAIAVNSARALCLPSAEEIERSLERLHFWCSTDIAPLVRSCRITPLVENRGPGWNVFPTDTPYILLAAFFERLPCFTRLQRLSARDVHFTQIGMANLYLLPALVHLDIISCKVTAGETIEPTSRAAGLSSFSLQNNGAGMDHWLPFLRPEHLREIKVRCNPRLFDETMATLPAFPHVRKLTANIALSTRTLLKFLAVEVLYNGSRISHDRSDPDVQTSRLVPVLKEYTGFHENLHLFLPAASLSRLTMRYCKNPHELMTQLQGMGTTQNITSLDASFGDMNHTSFDILCNFFTHLTELHLRILLYVEGSTPEDTDTAATLVLKALDANPTLPPTIEHLALIWEISYSDVEEKPSAIQPPDLAALRGALVSRCPALMSLWIDGEDFVLRWCKFADGTVDERMTYDGGGAGPYMRKEYHTFWSRGTNPGPESRTHANDIVHVWTGVLKIVLGGITQLVCSS